MEARRDIARNLLAQANSRKSLRAPIVSQREVMAELIRPLRADWTAASEGGNRGAGQRFDSTAMTAADMSGSTIYAELVGSEDVFAPLQFADKRLREDPEANEWLTQDVNAPLFARFDPAVDRFYAQAPLTILDALVFGDGCYFDSRPPGDRRFRSLALPWSQCCYALGNYGEVTHFDRWYRESVFNLSSDFGELPPSLQQKFRDTPNEKVEVLHTVVPRSAAPVVSDRFTFTSCYMLPTGEVLSWGGFREQPYNVCRWGITPGQDYGIGRGLFALPDVQTLQEMVRSTIIGAQKSAEPPMLAHDELQKLVSLDPGAMNFGALDDAGRPLIRPVDLGSRPERTLEFLQDRRQQVQDVFYSTLLTSVGSPSPSVAETLDHIERRQLSLGPNMQLVTTEFLAPLIMSRYVSLNRAGDFAPPPPQAEGAELRVSMNSNLAKLHRSRKARATLSFAEAVASVAQIDQEAALLLDGRNAVRAIHDGLGAPDDVMRSNDAVNALLEQMREQQQAQALLAAAEQTGRSAESFARAAQAEASAETQSREGNR